MIMDNDKEAHSDDENWKEKETVSMNTQTVFECTRVSKIQTKNNQKMNQIVKKVVMRKDGVMTIVWRQGMTVKWKNVLQNIRSYMMKQ